jgi:DNA-directed RNA polymerase I, II, and III subunit RPABC2
MENNKYVRARILSARSFEIAVDAPIHVKATGKERPLEIALKEMDEKKVPLVLYAEEKKD